MYGVLFRFRELSLGFVFWVMRFSCLGFRVWGCGMQVVTDGSLRRQESSQFKHNRQTGQAATTNTKAANIKSVPAKLQFLAKYDDGDDDGDDADDM